MDLESPQEKSARLERSIYSLVAEAVRHKAASKSFGHFQIKLVFKHGLIDMIEAGDNVTHK